MSVRKFYSDGTAEATGGSDEIVVGGPVSLGDILNQSSSETPSNESTEQTPSSDENSSEEGQSNEQGGQKPAEAGEQNQNVETGADAGQSSGEEGGQSSDEGQQNTIQSQPTELSLEEVLKGKDKLEVLKALGVSTEVFEALTSAQSLEDLQKFLSVRTRNLDSVSDEEILRENLRKEYADLDDAKFEKVFKAEMKKYNLDSFDEDERELGQIRLERDAARVRSQMKQEQAQFKLPEPKPSAEAQQLEEIRSAQAQAKADYDKYVTEITSAEASKKLLQDKRVVLADGYNFEVEQPQSVLDALIDTRNLFKSCINKDGSYNLERAFKIANYALNLEKVEAAYIEHGKSMVNQETLDELVNPAKRDNPGTGPKGESLAEAMASRGTHTTVGSILGL